MVLSKLALTNRSNALTVQSVTQVHLLLQPPYVVLFLFMFDVLLFMSIEKLCCSCLYQSCVVHVYIRSCVVHVYIRVVFFMFISEVVLFMFISEVVLFMFTSEVVYSQVLSGSSVTVVIDRSRSEGDEVVYTHIKCCV
jgi:hypothetical protein